MTDILQQARAWIDDDPDPVTREAGLKLLLKGDPKVLAEHFGARLEFGTAGIRGALGPGPGRMNRAIVRRVSAGLGDYLAFSGHQGLVVIGYDGRHGSLEFAHDAACVLAARGFGVRLYDRVCPTPQLAHAVVWCGAVAGVMVTASHNPPEDNGYKVYWGNGAQIISPHDKGISACIDAVGPTLEIPVPPLDQLRAEGKVQTIDPAAEAAYLAAVAALRVHHVTGARIVYTAMHGVGTRLVQTVLKAAGHTDLHLVSEQCEPDGDFPTVRFPNPEEPGALDLALAKAALVDADVLIANDPDADRLAVAVKHGGRWVPFDGNQTGVLLAEDLLEHGPGGERMVSNSIVSSTQLAVIAEHHGAEFVETLTGFKWIANAAIDYEAGGGRFVMGYEEALGYSIGSVARDKDGVSAALILCDLASWAKEQGRTLVDLLHDVYRKHGVYASAQHSLKLPGADGAARIQALMASLRETPPAELLGQPVTRARDLLLGTDADTVRGITQKTKLPKSNVLHWQFGPDLRVLARPSGTEPKIKFYFEVRGRVDGDVASAQNRVAATLQRAREEFVARLSA